jgi:hypothetical protein
MLEGALQNGEWGMRSERDVCSKKRRNFGGPQIQLDSQLIFIRLHHLFACFRICMALPRESAASYAQLPGKQE